jgi:hypothetical protein
MVARLFPSAFDNQICGSPVRMVTKVRWPWSGEQFGTPEEQVGRGTVSILTGEVSRSARHIWLTCVVSVAIASPLGRSSERVKSLFISASGWGSAPGWRLKRRR